MSEVVIGTCSLCGGPVTVPSAWGGILPPVGRCRGCGAEQKDPHGGTIEMVKKGERSRHGHFNGFFYPHCGHSGGLI